jgi:ribose transport system permease protein
VRGRLSSEVVVYIVLLATVLVAAVLVAGQDRSFFSTGNLADVLTRMSVLGLFAIGQTVVILAAGLDLSVSYTASLASLIAAGTMADQASNIVTGVALALLVGAAIGVFNGLVISFLRVPPFIATLGTGLILAGYLASNFSGTFGRVPAEFRLLGATRIGPVPVSTLMMLGIAFAVYLLLTRTRFGYHIYGVGGDLNVATLSGIRTKPILVGAYVLASVMAALAGLLLASRTGVGSPIVGSQGGYALLSIAAVVLGGTNLMGGRGSIVGTIGAVGILAVIGSTMSVLEINPFLQQTVQGVAIIAAVAVYSRRAIRRRTPRFGAHGTATRSVSEPAGVTP